VFKRSDTKHNRFDVQRYSETAVSIYAKIQIFRFPKLPHLQGFPFWQIITKSKGLSDGKAHHKAEKLLSQIGFGRFTKG